MTFPGALIISHLSTEYVVVPVTAVFDGVPQNPTNSPVQFAFTTGYGSTPATWVNGTWDPSPIQGAYYNAKCLIGPGTAAAIALPSSTYTIWIQVIDTPENPVRQAGTLIIQ